jgi:ATP-dependent DNA ligase
VRADEAHDRAADVHAFDVLSVDRRNVMRLPYVERRAILEELNLDGRFWRRQSRSTAAERCRT